MACVLRNHTPLEVATLEGREEGPLGVLVHLHPALGLAGRVLDVGSLLPPSKAQTTYLQLALPCIPLHHSHSNSSFIHRLSKVCFYSAGERAVDAGEGRVSRVMLAFTEASTVGTLSRSKSERSCPRMTTTTRSMASPSRERHQRKIGKQAGSR